MTGGDLHLDLRIRFSHVVGYDGEAEIQHVFHLLAISLFSLVHTEQTYADFVIKMLDALCLDWRMKLIGSSTDEVGNMTGHTSGFSTLLLNQSLCSDAFYRIWCLAHQLDLVIKGSIDVMVETGVFVFMNILTKVIVYLRHQKKHICEIGSKCPYYINVRWTSLAKVRVGEPDSNLPLYAREKLCSFSISCMYVL